MNPSGDIEDKRLLSRGELLALSGILFVVVLLFLRTLLLSPENCLGRAAGDARNQFYGWRAYGFGQVKVGRFPLWNPYEFLGMPFVAGLQSAMFYPTNWLCAAMPLGRAINIGILLNIFLSAAFTYLWVRRLGVSRPGAAIAGLVYALGAPQFLRIFEGHWSFLCSMPWIPCILLCVELIVQGRARLLAVAGGGIAVAMQLFGGNPQYAFYGGIAAGLYFIGRRLQAERGGLREWLKAGACFAGMYVLGAAMAGVQLLPALELLSVSSRQGQLSYDWIKQYSMTPESLITLLVPDAFGSDAGAQYWGRWNLWEMSAYVGVAAVAAAAFALARRFRGPVRLGAILALAMLLLALGEHTPLLWLLYHTVPGFNLFRSVSRFLCPFSVFMALLAGLGTDALANSSEPVDSSEEKSGRARKRMRRIIAGAAGVAAAFGIFGLLLLPDWESGRAAWTTFMDAMLSIKPGQRLYLPYGIVDAAFKRTAMAAAGASLLRSAAFIGAVAVVAAFVMARRCSRRTAYVLLTALVALDLLTFSARYLDTFDPRADGLTPGALAALKADTQPFRYARGGDFRFPQCEGMTNEICCLEGIQPNVPGRFRDVFWALQGRSKDEQRTVYSLYGIFPPHRMLNLKYIVQDKRVAPVRTSGARQIYEDDRLRVTALPNAFPRAWLVHYYEVVPDADELLAALPHLNYERFALLEADPGLSLSPAPQSERIPVITRYEANRVEIEAEPASSALLVMSDLHYPGWRALSDGEPTPLYRANYLMRAVHVPAGRHTVVFEYRPASFRIGVGLSLAGALAGAVLVTAHVLGKRKRQEGVAP